MGKETNLFRSIEKAWNRVSKLYSEGKITLESACGYWDRYDDGKTWVQRSGKWYWKDYGKDTEKLIYSISISFYTHNLGTPTTPKVFYQHNLTMEE